MIDPRLADYELDSYPKAPEPKPAPAQASQGIQEQRKAIPLSPLEEVKRALANGQLTVKNPFGKYVK